MSTIQSLRYLMGITPSNLNKKEILLLEAEIFSYIYQELKKIFRTEYKDYFSLMHFTTEQENDMFEANFVRLIIRDIISTNEYDLKGVAQYTNTHCDVIEEMITGRNRQPSATFLQRLISLHHLVCEDVYFPIMRKLKRYYSAY